MGRLTIIDTPLPGVRLVERTPLTDARGSLTRLFCADELLTAGWTKPIAQINQSITRGAGAVRGMHFQRGEHAEMKLVCCLRGRIWDVAVDIRADSPTFLTWHAEELSDANGRSMIVPEGFAHGFQVLSDECELLYLHSAAYSPIGEGGLRASDPRLAIAWPLPISMLSPRDAGHPLIEPGFAGLRL
jgi:dTDP-4-dehydrorhamnose 3,5-epimerase